MDDTPKTPPPATDGEADAGAPEDGDRVPETGGRGGPDPTRFGDWEKNGRCIDF